MEIMDIEVMYVDFVGMLFCFKECEVYYVVVLLCDFDVVKQIVYEFVLFFQLKMIEKIVYNLKYDMCVLMCYGFEFDGLLFDMMIVYYFIQLEVKQGMDFFV